MMMDMFVKFIKDLVEVLTDPYAMLGFFVLISIVLIIKIREKIIEKKYEKTTYFDVTHIPYKNMKKDLGRYGEYLVYMNTREYEEQGAKFLFNVYVPKANGETSEIDVLMISKKGLFVFESKNYSGWIFGDEKVRNWTQTLPTGKKSRKEHFYNPVKQNDSHIKNLKEFLNLEVPFFSIITFSERCTLKDVKVLRGDVKVINRDETYKVVSWICQTNNDVLSPAEIDEIYNKLYPLTQVSEDVKQKHIENIEEKTEAKPVPKKAEPKIQEDKKTEPEEPKCEEPKKGKIEKEEPKKEVPQNIEEPKTQEHICPICGGKLVLRTAKKGPRAGKQFYGCENYPKCKYTKNI